MARTALTVQTIPANGVSLDDIAMTAGDATNDHEYLNDGTVFVLMKNADASPHTATLISVADEYGRTEDETMTCAAGESCIAGPFKPRNWNQAGGLMHVDLTVDTSVSFAVLKFTPNA